MNKKRPVNLDIGTIQLPITSYVSILHRVSGVVLFAAIAVFLWVLDASLSSEESFNAIKDCIGSTFFQLIIWASLAALAYHLVAGVRHLVMDFGVGETLEGGRLGAMIALIAAAVLIVLAGVLGMGMITNVTSFGRSGLSDWILQRATAVVMTVYTVFITVYLLTNPDMDYGQWLALNSHISMKVLNVLTSCLLRYTHGLDCGQYSLIM